MPSKPKYRPSYVAIDPDLKAEIQFECVRLKIPFNQAVMEGLQLWLSKQDS